MLRKIPCFMLVAEICGIGLIPQAFPAAQVIPSTPPLTEILVDGKPLVEASTDFQVPASHKAVSFRLGQSTEDRVEGSRRIRFKLDGIDNGWREMTSEMCLTVRFSDAAGDQVGQQIFQVSGRSTGWNGNIENSKFTPRQEMVRVPPEGQFLTVAISSSGPPTAIGAYVVQGLKVVSAAKALLETDIAGDLPKGWTRSGTRPSMAKIVRTNSGNAFCIVDDDPNTHAEWILTRAAASAVQPGEWITVQWSEMYSIGTGRHFDVNYGMLNAGAYRFWAEEEDLMGAPLGAPKKFEFVVLQPFWKTGWFRLSGAATLGVLIWLGCRAIIRTRIHQHLARAEQEHMVERERLRIARDLHDDLGARLTHISLVSGLAENDPQSASARENFQRISGMARDLVAALYQTVWTVNPENDHLEALVNYLCQLTQSLCEAAGIRCRIHSCAVPDGRRVTSEIRHHIILAVKEAVHNAIKHAGATEIEARMDFTDPRLTITIVDNGRGFDPAIVAPGCGLANMRRRMEAIGGALNVEKPLTSMTSSASSHTTRTDLADASDIRSGTRIRFDVSIPGGSKTSSHSSLL